MIQVLLSQPKHWETVKLVMTHFDHLETFVEIQSHLKMEEERLKTFSSSSVAVVAEGNLPRGNKNNWGRQYKKMPHSYQKSRSKTSIGKKQKAKGNGEKNTTRVKRYNCGKKNHYAHDYFEPPKRHLSLLILLSYLFVPIH